MKTTLSDDRERTLSQNLVRCKQSTFYRIFVQDLKPLLTANLLGLDRFALGMFLERPQSVATG